MRPLVFLCFLVLTSTLPAVGRDHYRPAVGVLPDGRAVFRTWDEGDEVHWLAVDPETLATSTGTEPFAPGEPPPTSLWVRLKTLVEGRRQRVENTGLQEAAAPPPGAWLTFDLCPSPKPLDRAILQRLEATQRPLPVMLEVSGRWLDTHDADFEWLLAERRAGRLAVTWVNHTDQHRYLPAVPARRNFLLLPDTDLDAEVFGLEQKLLDRGEVPSVFFRFPGLISSPELVDRVVALGLVPLGSQAWLAKDQTIAEGDFVLTHANGNEPEGLRRLQTWVDAHAAEFASGAWRWLGPADWPRVVARARP